MSRLCSSRTLLAVLVAMLLISHAPSAVGDAVTCPRVAFSPVLDSHLDDWSPLPHVVMAVPTDWRPAAAQFSEYGGPEDISAEVRLAWDSQSLYVSVVTRDDQLVRVRSAAEIDRGDSIVLSLVGEDADKVNQFVVVLLRAASLVWRAEPAEEAGEVRTVGRALAAKADPAGGSRLIYELAIPWAELKQLRPLPGRSFTLTVSVCDDDGDGLKGCLERAVPVVLSTTGIAAPAAPRPAAFKPSFPSPQVARFDEKCFKLNGTDVLLVGGEIQYSLLPKDAWGRRVDLLKSAGLNTVGVTVPWAVHQPTSGPPDLGSLRQFLDLCKAAGLWVQLNIGPFAGETWEAGGVPGWAVALGSDEDVKAAVAQWLESVFPVAAEYQLSAGGPVATVVVRPLPDRRGQVSAAKLEPLLASARSADVVVPILTWNAAAARGGATQAMANIVDTLGFYRPADITQLTAQLQTLEREEIGPAVITALPGEQRSPEAARRSADLVRVALANGAAAVMMSDFAPGVDASLVREPGSSALAGAIDAAGAVTSGYGEARLLGAFLRASQPQLVRATAAPDVVKSDDPSVRALVRYGKKQAFLFLWDEEGKSSRQVRLSYTDPETEKVIAIPEAGAIYLPAGGAKILPLDMPVGRGSVRYCTSEVLFVHSVGERTLLVLYGDPDTPGEIALRLPGPPLVIG
ncbi:MAG: beta-galactosidase, partial [Armatimonadetes bacterium]|nr:beta-galactosidase [Armatimonadota bacterium]